MLMRSDSGSGPMMEKRLLSLWLTKCKMLKLIHFLAAPVQERKIMLQLANPAPQHCLEGCSIFSHSTKPLLFLVNQFKHLNHCEMKIEVSRNFSLRASDKSKRSLKCSTSE
jgi:hypothetical protein